MILRNSVNGTHAVLLSVILGGAFLLAGCQGVALSNRTNQPLYAGGKEFAYEAQHDTFLHTSPTWTYVLKVTRKNRVDKSSVSPRVVIEGTVHGMIRRGDWNGDVSYWSYARQPDCINTSTPVRNSQYYFSVGYSRPNSFVDKPPGRTPSPGSFYTSRLLNMGFGFHPSPIFSNYQASNGIIYSQNCWQTGLGCVPDWKYEGIIQIGDWPGPSSRYEHRLLLVNSEPADATITEMTLGAFGQDSTGFQNFEIVSPVTPFTVDSCGGQAFVTIRYKPGFNQVPAFTAGYYNHKFIFNSKILWPGLASPANGPWIRADYTVFVNPQ